MGKRHQFTEEDIRIIIDAFTERLPAVWQDAQQELDGGKPLAEVVSEMRNGHVLRVLNRSGFDTENWIQEFVDFMVGNGKAEDTCCWGQMA